MKQYMRGQKRGRHVKGETRARQVQRLDEGQSIRFRGNEENVGSGGAGDLLSGQPGRGWQRSLGTGEKGEPKEHMENTSQILMAGPKGELQVRHTRRRLRRSTKFTKMGRDISGM